MTCLPLRLPNPRQRRRSHGKSLSPCRICRVLRQRNPPCRLFLRRRNPDSPSLRIMTALSPVWVGRTPPRRSFPAPRLRSRPRPPGSNSRPVRRSPYPLPGRPRGFPPCPHRRSSPALRKRRARTPRHRRRPCAFPRQRPFPAKHRRRPLPLPRPPLRCSRSPRPRPLPPCSRRRLRRRHRQRQGRRFPCRRPRHSRRQVQSCRRRNLSPYRRSLPVFPARR